MRRKQRCRHRCVAPILTESKRELLREGGRVLPERNVAMVVVGGVVEGWTGRGRGGREGWWSGVERRTSDMMRGEAVAGGACC